MSAICKEGLGATIPHVSDVANQYVIADKPETTNSVLDTQTSTPHSTTWRVYPTPAPSI